MINAHQTKQKRRRQGVYLKRIQIMIVKMIQNLENKMELQINRLDRRIEKMQEMFNKDLEEIKSQSIVDSATAEIKALWREPTAEQLRQKRGQERRKADRCGKRSREGRRRIE